MGAEKFHIAVTIDGARRVADFLTSRFLQNLLRRKRLACPFLGASTSCACPAARESRLQFYCHVRRLKMRLTPDFHPVAYVSPRCRLRSIPFPTA
jgi:hypothetical protein